VLGEEVETVTSSLTELSPARPVFQVTVEASASKLVTVRCAP
jgi:hypothetical protein